MRGVFNLPTRIQALVNKLLYRSKQRGFLELDLLMGLWAEQEVPRMSHDMLHDFSAVLDEVCTLVLLCSTIA